MRCIFIVAAACVISMSGCKSSSQKDQDALQGDWVLESMEAEGQKLDLGQFQEFLGGEIRLNVSGSQLKFAVYDKEGKEKEMKGDGGPGSGTFKLDAGKSPKQIDLVGKKKDGKEETVKGVYDLSGDTFRLCTPKSEADERPTEVASSKDKKTTVLTFKRKK